NCLYVAIDLAADCGVGTVTPTDMDVKAIDGIAVVVDCDARADQADVANIVLRAGMMTAGEMDIDRSIQRDARVAPMRDLLGAFLGMRGGEAAAGRAGAGDETGADRGRLRGEAECGDL